MSDDPGSLANLRDLALPPEVSFWPPAPGLWIVTAACGALLAIMLWRMVQRYRATAYRRAAIAELNAIAAGIGRGDPAIVERISAILKRVAMVDYGREQVAFLSGLAWADFIKAKASFEAQTLHALLSGVYRSGPPPDAFELHKFIGDATRWIRSRRKPLSAET
ncbi:MULTISPECIES: DUF4381 domain-containing protein [unclassified Beijerinckia]|uniref:DUF4381 domain-containing protein n=1 Tax=unclassified Beijerinckia TaxID=2638183 RepID=UPI000897A854|nr:MULTISPECIES: DUF4381 domain-containing protein [unclassified Beijerinckia]MDH7799857.1 hypothetical protein [Beijerinckia sp. GAS462]SED40024.1 protein of unknown function [Beijerinckia sp. 28-YEA-48]